MNSKLKNLLQNSGVKESLIHQLEVEEVTDFVVFRRLSEQDVKLLYKKYDISIGQYSTLRHVLTQEKTGTVTVANDTDSSISGSSGSIAYSSSSSSISSISDTSTRNGIGSSIIDSSKIHGKGM